MDRFFWWVAGWVEIACGLAVVISFGHWFPKWDFDYTVWNSIRMLRKKKAQQQEKV